MRTNETKSKEPVVPLVARHAAPQVNRLPNAAAGRIVAKR